MLLTPNFTVEFLTIAVGLSHFTLSSSEVWALPEPSLGGYCWFASTVYLLHSAVSQVKTASSALCQVLALHAHSHWIFLRIFIY